MSKKPVCEALGLKDPIETFKPGPFPKHKHVILHLFFHLRAMSKQNSDDAARLTAESLLDHWAPSGLPLMKLKNAQKKVKQFYERLRELTKMKKGNSFYQTKKTKFLSDLEISFDVSAKDALDIIAADKTLSPAEKDEDRNFLLAIRENRPHSLGVLDVKRIKRLKKAAEREQQALDRVEKESKRKEVKFGVTIVQ